ncbi:MAG TPA: divergent polysaccharide deacetylase family protein [Pseudolabrys sp.]|nr:divergent polysaccharide deacetylase family protein [Pseudolabrys sp.]
MAPDELNAPLGQNKAKKPPKLSVAAPQFLAGMLGLFGVVVIGWAAFVHDPLGGEPVAVVATGAQSPNKMKSAAEGDGTHHARHDGVEADASALSGPSAAGASAAPPKLALPPGAKTVTIIDGSSGERQEVVIPGSAATPSVPSRPSAAAPPPAPQQAPLDPKLMETTRHGAIPKIGADGERAAAFYARPRVLPPGRKDFPRIAVVVGGLGISASGTAAAMSDLPKPVTFALAPYGTDLPKLAERARAEGHELLLQVPMEPFDYPDNDPGPQTLLTTLSADQNIDRLHWLMSRFSGYVGLVSYMGARFSAAEQSIGPVLAETAKRGLIYVDDGSSPRSVAGQLAGGRGLPFAKTDIVLDQVPTPAEIDRALARLELTARENGSAVALAAAQPSTVARIAAWAKKVEDRGFVLVPISMVAGKAKSS